MTVRKVARSRSRRQRFQYVSGIGQDSHRFETGRARKPLVLAGVIIPGWPGLKGNSDADVVLHAVTNAVSGISGVNILGDVADRLCLERGILDSCVYLKMALTALGPWRITHVSVSIEAKRPRLQEHLPAMRESLSRICSLTIDDIGITATTGEGLTAFGKGLGISALAIVSAQR